MSNRLFISCARRSFKRAASLRAISTSTSRIPSLALISASRVSSIASRPFSSSAAASASAVHEFKLADIGEGIAEVEIIQWFVNEGDDVKQFDRICEVQSDKATVEITSRYDGVIKSLQFDVGDMAAVGSTLVEIETEDAPAPSPSSSPEPAEKSTISSEKTKAVRSTANAGTKVLTTPAVRRLAREHDLDLSEILGTGKGGRLLKSDVLEFIDANNRGDYRPDAESPSPPSSPIGAPAQAHTPIAVERAPRAGAMTEDVVVPLRGIQKMMAKAMETSLTVPHFNLMDEIDMTQLAAMRGQLKETAVKRGLQGFSFMPVIIKAASLSLVEYPELNAHVNEDCSAITHRASHNISVAVDTPRGLLVPSIKNVQNLTLLDIAAELERVTALGREGKLGEEDLAGGTFSLSNIGAVGGTYASPVILPSAGVVIGALGRIQTLPRFDENGSVRAAKLMNVSWSGDHRVVDGATMARYNNQLKEYLENPETMLMNLA